MKLFGYAIEPETDSPLELTEATLVVSPEELRKLASFLQATAEEMEKSGSGFGHTHLQDWANSPQDIDIIIASSNRTEGR